MRRLGLLFGAIAMTAAGCATAAPTRAFTAPADVDISGQWDGAWSSYDVQGTSRRDDATASFVQDGSYGTGRVALHTTGVAPAVPVVVRDAGLTGVRIRFDVSGSQVVMRHELGGLLFTADLTVDGDRMVGAIRGKAPVVKVVLTRAKPVVAAVAPAPPPAAPAALAPAPPKEPEPVAPEPPKAPEPVAMAPAPPPAEPAPPAPAEFAGVDEVKPIHFDFDRDAIRPDDARILEANIEWLKQNADLLVRIEGYCDERGTAEYNLALGERRAQAARDYLVSNGMDAERISIVSFGNEGRLCTEATDDCWTQNRRATFLVKPR